MALRTRPPPRRDTRPRAARANSEEPGGRRPRKFPGPDRGEARRKPRRRASPGRLGFGEACVPCARPTPRSEESRREKAAAFRFPTSREGA